MVIINPYSNWQERIYRLPKEWTDDDLFMLIEQFIRNRSQYQTLLNYYIGRHNILNRTFDSVHKPNHKIVNNYPKLLVNTATSYFAGTPITFIPKCQDLPMREIHKVLRENNEVSVNGSLVKTSYKMGHAKEIHWCTKDGRHRFKHRSPQNLMVVYSNDLDEEMLAAVDVYENIDPMTSLVTYDITVYDKENIRKFRSTNNLGSGFEAYGSTIPHHFEEVPVIEVFNNEERMSIFEDVISLIDAQNLTISDSVNDIAEIGDSILKVTGMPETDESDLKELRQNRVAVLEEGGDMAYINRQIESSHSENIKNRNDANIHKFSGVPDLASYNYSSGISLEHITQSLEHIATNSELQFKIALQKRFRLILRTLSIKTGEDYTNMENDIEAKFTRNTVQNLVAIADAVVKLRNVVSDETLRSQVKFVHDLEREQELLNAQFDAEIEREVMRETLLLSGNGNTLNARETQERVISDYQEGYNQHNLQLESSGDG